MLLLRALNTIPLWILIVGLLAVFELYSVGLMLLARRKWGIDRLKLNNEVAGFKFSVIGVLYAVLLAFVVIAVWVAAAPPIAALWIALTNATVAMPIHVVTIFAWHTPSLFEAAISNPFLHKLQHATF